MENKYYLVVHQLMRDGLETKEPGYSIMTRKDIEQHYNININIASYKQVEFCELHEVDKQFLLDECGIEIERLNEFEVRLEIIENERIERFISNKLEEIKFSFETIIRMANS